MYELWSELQFNVGWEVCLGNSTETIIVGQKLRSISNRLEYGISAVDTMGWTLVDFDCPEHV